MVEIAAYSGAGLTPSHSHDELALGWFQIANRHTFSYLFRRDLSAARTIERHRALIIDVVLQFMRSTPSNESRSAQIKFPPAAPVLPWLPHGARAHGPERD